MALAHAVGNKVEAAYRRGDLFDKRWRLMDDWSLSLDRVRRRTIERRRDAREGRMKKDLSNAVSMHREQGLYTGLGAARLHVKELQTIRTQTRWQSFVSA